MVRIDVDQDQSVAEGVAQAGQIDVLVNNAGIGGGGPVELRPVAKAKQTFETNYFGAVRMIQAVLPAMRERGGGTIVNVTSIAGRVAFATHGHYAASKFALDALSEILAAEVRPFGIRVAIVEPGVVLTPIFSKHSGQATKQTVYDMPYRRLQRSFQKQLQNPTMPDVVAAAIEHAITTDQPRLRYLVGEDARVLAAGRGRMSDEAWVSTQAIQDDEEFFDRMKAEFGVEMYR